MNVDIFKHVMVFSKSTAVRNDSDHLQHKKWRRQMKFNEAVAAAKALKDQAVEKYQEKKADGTIDATVAEGTEVVKQGVKQGVAAAKKMFGR